jgi:hypothetical protein
LIKGVTDQKPASIEVGGLSEKMAIIRQNEEYKNESDCMHKIRTAGGSSAQRGGKACSKAQ